MNDHRHEDWKREIYEQCDKEDEAEMEKELLGYDRRPTVTDYNVLDLKRLSKEELMSRVEISITDGHEPAELIDAWKAELLRRLEPQPTGDAKVGTVVSVYCDKDGNKVCDVAWKDHIEFGVGVNCISPQPSGEVSELSRCEGPYDPCQISACNNEECRVKREIQLRQAVARLQKERDGHKAAFDAVLLVVQAQAPLKAIADHYPKVVEALSKANLCPACGGRGEVDISAFGGITPTGTMEECPCCEGEDYSPDFYANTPELVAQTLAHARELMGDKEQDDECKADS